MINKGVDTINTLDGKKVKLELLKELKSKLQDVSKLGLAVIQIGDDKASSVYVRQKEKLAKELNYDFKHIKLESTVEEQKVLEIIDNLNRDDKVDGIIVQMPIPSHLNTNRIQNAVSHEKDVDGLTDINMGQLVHNKDSLVACTPKGIVDLLDFYGINISGKKVVIIGRSNLVGKPLFNLMINRNATVTMCHSRTNNLELETKNADILVVAIGKPLYIKNNHVKEGAIVIDVGINRLDGKIVGDVDFDSVKEKCSYITPVPGGVGQMTVFELMNNTYNAHILRKRVKR